MSSPKGAFAEEKQVLTSLEAATLPLLESARTASSFYRLKSPMICKFWLSGRALQKFSLCSIAAKARASLVLSAPTPHPDVLQKRDSPRVEWG